MNCSWPTCNDEATKGIYCFMHNRVYGSATVKPVKPIPKVSDKQKIADREYKKLIQLKLKNNPNCEMKTPACTGKAQGGHHVKRRGKNLMNEGKLILSCNACNTWVEANHQQAKEMGLLESKYN